MSTELLRVRLDPSIKTNPVDDRLEMLKQDIRLVRRRISPITLKSSSRHDASSGKVLGVARWIKSWCFDG